MQKYKGCRSSSSAEDLIGFSGAGNKRFCLLKQFLRIKFFFVEIITTGLYESYTHKFNSEGPLDATIRQVFSSVFTNRAYYEREIHGYWLINKLKFYFYSQFYLLNTRIDHLKVYMGVLIHLPYGTEQANGVLVFVFYCILKRF